MEDNSNGFYSKMISDMQKDFNDLEQKVDHGIGGLATAISNLTTQIGTLAENMGKFIPIKIVYLLFALVFGLVFGIEAIKYVFKVMLPH